MNCWKCGAELALSSQYAVKGSICKVPFRAACDHCQAPLHCCRNCQHYKRGLPNDCEVPDTEFISDREAANHCEDFLILGKKQSTPSSQEIAKRLFGDEPEEKKKKDPFDDLFK